MGSTSEMGRVSKEHQLTLFDVYTRPCSFFSSPSFVYFTDILFAPSSYCVVREIPIATKLFTRILVMPVDHC